MRRTMLGMLLLGALTQARPALAQDSGPAIAVLPFADGGSYGQDKQTFEALETGIQALLLSELTKNPAVRTVERSAVRRSLGARNPGAHARVDAATAAQVGRAVGARYAIFGSFVDLYGRFRLNARIVNVQTGEILKVVSNDEPKLQDRQSLHQIIQVVAGRILEATGVPANPGNGAGASSVPTDALTLYSLGLAQEDRGERAKAAELYRKALEAAPAFAEARAALQRAGGS